jgi:hypothetical protein
MWRLSLFLFFTLHTAAQRCDEPLRFIHTGFSWPLTIPYHTTTIDKLHVLLPYRQLSYQQGAPCTIVVHNVWWWYVWLPNDHSLFLVFTSQRTTRTLLIPLRTWNMNDQDKVYWWASSRTMLFPHTVVWFYQSRSKTIWRDNSNKYKFMTFHIYLKRAIAWSLWLPTRRFSLNTYHDITNGYFHLFFFMAPRTDARNVTIQKKGEERSCSFVLRIIWQVLFYIS